MRTKGSSDELEHRRQLAVQRFLNGYSADEIADSTGSDCASRNPLHTSGASNGKTAHSATTFFKAAVGAH